MGVIDISGPIFEGMWYYGEPYMDMPVTPPRIHEVEFPPKYAGRIFTQMLDMCVQTGTYLETAAHGTLGEETIDEVSLDRTWMIPTVVIHAVKGPGEKVTLEEGKASLAEQNMTISPGDAVLVHTGWDTEWTTAERYLSEHTYLSRELCDWIIDSGASIIGCDTPRADSVSDPQGFFPRLFSDGRLLLAPVANLGKVPNDLDEKPRLCVLPLALEGACASPVRAVLVT